MGLTLGLAACGRSQLDLAPAPLLPAIDAAAVLETPPDAPVEAAADVAPDRAPDVAPDLPPDAPPDLGVERVPDARPEVAPPPPPPPPVDGGPACAPRPETCNGVDDDCNGKIDDGLPSIPCPNGGARYCVSGAYSECPRRCEVCVPGSQRECFTTFCTNWGTETCASDGRSFSTCKEAKVPAACKPLASGSMPTPELEQCCLDQGLCCLDQFDLNHDGDKGDMLGNCTSVTCGP